MDKNYIIILYIRLSVEDEDSREGIKDESNSVTNQRDLLRQYVESCREFHGCEIIELCDDGYSGTNMQRPNMQKLLQKARAKEIDCIIVKDFSRFGRDYITVSDYVDQIFPFLGIRLISVNDGYDSADMGGKTSGVDIAFRNVIYGYYSQDLSLKVKSGKRTKALRGDFLSPFAPIGYRKSKDNKNQLVIDEDSAGIVRRIFQLAGIGMSTLEIARLFNWEKVPTPRAIKNRQGYHHKWWIGVEGTDLWDHSMITRILRDERYLGTVIYGKRYRQQVGAHKTLKNSKSDWIIVEKKHEPLVTKEEFQAAQNHLAEFMEKESIQPDVTLFTGKIRCGHCGYTMLRRSAPTPRFYCSTKDKAAGYGCMKGNIRESEIADVVLSAIHAYIRVLLDEKSLLIEAGSGGRISKLQKQILTYKAICNGIAEEKAQWYDAMADGKINREQYQQKREKLSEEQTCTKRRANQLETQLMELQNKLSAARQGESRVLEYLQADTLTRQMVVDFVDCIYVYHDGSLHIDWTFREKGEENNRNTLQ